MLRPGHFPFEVLVTVVSHSSHRSVLISELQENGLFFVIEVAVFAGFQVTELDIHESDTCQFDDTVTEVIAHPSYLTVESLVKDNGKASSPGHGHFAGESDLSEDRKPAFHLCLEVVGYGTIYLDAIFFLVAVLCSEQLVDYVSVVSEQDQA